jgi:uncharacterized membrane protein
MLSSWLHLLALTVYIGSLIGLWVVFLPSLAGIKNHETRAKLLVRGLKLYNPLQCGALGVLVISGAFQLTALKAAYRELFVKELGGRLGLKLSLSFVLIILSTYQSMGVAHRYVRRYEAEENTTPQDVELLIRRLRSSTPAILFVALLTSLAGIWLRR